jgi:hypothetical protein
MSTGPGPTRKADGTTDASVDDIADLLVEDEHSTEHAVDTETSEDSLEVMLETPSPVVANPFMPPPPSPMGDASEESESAEDNGAATNLAYEDLLAKLVLPAKAPEPEPQMPALMSSLPMPESVTAPLPPPSMPALRPSGQTLQVAPPAEERTLVTENPLVAEEQEAAVREGRMSVREPMISVPVQEDFRQVPTAPVAAAANGVAKSRLLYLMLGGLLVLGGMILAVLVLKLLMPTPPPAAPTQVVAPVPPPPPPSAPPAHVEPLPPSAPPAAAIPPEPAPVPENTAGVPEAPAVEPERAAPRPHRPAAHPRPPRQAAPKPAPAAKAAAPKVAPAPKPAPEPKPAKASKKAKSSGYADPFDN